MIPVPLAHPLRLQVCGTIGGLRRFLSPHALGDVNGYVCIPRVHSSNFSFKIIVQFSVPLWEESQGRSWFPFYRREN